MHLGAFGALQKVKNWAARIATGCNRQDHTTTCLKSLNWLSVLQRIAFKISLLMLYYHQAIWLHLSSGTRHSVFSDIYCPDRSLLYQEPSQRSMALPPSHTLAQQSLNSLSLSVISATTLAQLRSSLKIHLCHIAFVNWNLYASFPKSLPCLCPFICKSARWIFIAWLYYYYFYFRNRKNEAERCSSDGMFFVKCG
jgi:hypothetical protein